MGNVSSIMTMPQNTDNSKVCATKAISVLSLPPRIHERIVNVWRRDIDVKLYEFLRLSQTCHLLRKVVIQQLTRVGSLRFPEALLRSCRQIHRPSVTFKRVEGFWNFLKNTSKSIELFHLPQLCLHFGPTLEEIGLIDFNALGRLDVTVCHPDDWDILRTILDNSSVHSLFLTAAEEFCCDGCRLCVSKSRKCWGRLCHDAFFTDVGAISRAIEPRAADLRLLTLTNWNIKEGCEFQIWRTVTGLLDLDIENCGDTDFDLQEIANSMPGIQKLAMKGSSFSQISAGAEAVCFKNLTRLKLTGNLHYYDSAIEFPNVSHLWFTDMFQPLSMCLSHEASTPLHPPWLTGMRGQLKSLCFFSCYGLNDELIDMLISNNPGLRQIDIAFYELGEPESQPLSDKGFDKLSALTKLRYFSFLDYSGVSSRLSHISVNLCSRFTPQMFPHLRFLGFYSTRLGFAQSADAVRERFKGKCSVVCSEYSECSQTEFEDKFWKAEEAAGAWLLDII